MVSPHRRFTVQKKLAFPGEADKIGITVIIDKYNLSHSVFNRTNGQYPGNIYLQNRQRAA